MKIYVASSWRNKFYPEVIKQLRSENHEIYDFQNPDQNGCGFRWDEIDKDWKNWTTKKYIHELHDYRAQLGFFTDFHAMQSSNLCVLVLPAGRSANLEAGWFVGANKPLVIFCPEPQEPELMYLMATRICRSIEELKIVLESDIVWNQWVDKKEKLDKAEQQKKIFATFLQELPCANENEAAEKST